jgi:UDP-N-acetylglucosamine 1-carboxyvinyltransferase
LSQLTINGGKPLSGRVDLKGAKNLVTKAMVASLLGETPSTLLDVPHISDVEIVARLLNLHGVSIEHDEATGNMVLDPGNRALDI